MAEKDLIADARAQFDMAEEAESLNRQLALEDIRFARLAEQWPDKIREQREAESRPCLTINRIPAFARQVTNDVRQNRPSINARPVGDGSDRETAELISGLIRNIEISSNADVAYDTGAEAAVYGGFGYWRVDVDYTYDDSFDLDLKILRIANPFSVYGDPKSTEADSCDWRFGFVAEWLSRDEFKRRFKGAAMLDFDEAKGDEEPWWEEDRVRIAEWWKRDEAEDTIVKLSNGLVMPAARFQANAELFTPAGITVVGERNIKSYKVVHRLISGQEVLEQKDWAGKYIPIVPVYGEEVWVENRRYFKSLFRDAKDAQRMFNFWRTAATEAVALAPKVPFIGPAGAFKGDKRKWETANVKSHPYIEYDGAVAPQRQPLDMGAAAGAMSEALAAQDDMKSIMGLYDASLGQRSNETSGRAIIARQREGDTSTFHFIDNVARAIRHTGRILIDLIPSVYTGERVLRVVDEASNVSHVPIGVPVMQTPAGWQKAPPDAPKDVTKIFDLGAGKYDVEVRVGPGYTTRREEAALGMQAMFQANPATAQLLGDIYARMQDWPEADKVEQRLKAALPPHLKGEAPPPEMQQMQAQLAQLGSAAQQLQQENQALKAQGENKLIEAQIKAEELQFKREELQFKREELQAKMVEARLEAQQEAQRVVGEQVGAFAEQHNQAMMPLAQTVQALAQRIEEVAAAVKRPKRGRAMKGPDGAWMMETIDDELPMQ